MGGSVFRRCTKCGSRVPDANGCVRCSADTFSWAFIADVGTDAKGRRRQRKRMGFRSKRDAERAMREVLSKVDRSSYVEPTKLTVREHLLERWMPATRRNLSPTTWTERRRVIVNHIVPYIGSVPLQELEPAHLNQLYTELLENGKARGSGGLSKKTVREVHVILRKALKDAGRWGLVERNVADLADPPSATAAAMSRYRSIMTWTPDQLRTFVAHAIDDDWHPLWLVAASTGLRRGELLGLAWEDVDLLRARIAVRRSLVTVDGVPHLREATKSRTSMRVVDIDRRIAEELLHHRERQGRRRSHLDAAWHDHDLVFDRGDGVWLNPDHVSKRFRKLTEAAGVPRLRFHDLRHTHATLLLDAGENVKVVQERLGHHSASFTLDTYGHVTETMQRRAADRFGDLALGRPTPPAVPLDEYEDGPGRGR